MTVMQPILFRRPTSFLRLFGALTLISIWAFQAVSDVAVVLRIEKMRQHMQVRFEAIGEQRLQQWHELIQASKKLTDQQKLVQINNFFHDAVVYQTDIDLFGEEDYWASPLELMGYGSGDCEDWAIAKYLTLKILGVSDDKLRLIYVQYTPIGEEGMRPIAHMVLGYYATPTAEPLILDSLSTMVLKASKRPDLKPVFSFNSQGLWAGQGDVRSSKSSVAKLSKWRSVLERSNAEGIEFRG